MANAQFTFEPVQYLAKDDNNAADELLHKAMAEVDEQEKIIKAEDYPAKEDEEYAQEYEYEERQPMIEGPDLLYFALDKIASRTKHISFSSEGEYRLIVTTFFNLREMIKYRSSRSTLVPYVPVKLPNPDRFPSSHRVIALGAPEIYVAACGRACGASRYAPCKTVSRILFGGDLN